MALVDRKKIESIYPITEMQESFLFHHLQMDEDEGFLRVELKMQGLIDFDLFKLAWEKVFKRHAALRTSIHWEKIEKPVQIIHTDVELPLKFLDFTNLDDEQFQLKIDKIKNEKFKNLLDLRQASVNKLKLVKIKEDKHLLFWDFHHMLLDGWSSSMIISDALSYYEALIGKKDLSLPPLPTYKVYYDWLKSQDMDAAEQFWRTALIKSDIPTLFVPKSRTNKNNKGTHKDLIISTTKNYTEKINSFAKQNKLTINTIIKGVWAILLSVYFDSKLVTFGSTVSGRSNAIDDVNLMSGLFMNVLPIQIEIDGNTDLISWLHKIQLNQTKVLKFESVSLNKISIWLQDQESVLFDSLIVFENFPWDQDEMKSLYVKDFSGGFTSTFPLTVMILPNEVLKIKFRYNEDVFSKDMMEWMTSQVKSIITIILSSTEINLNEIKQQVSEIPDLNKPEFEIENSKGYDEINYVPPTNESELRLTQLWEKVLRVKPISVVDNFFETGGKSIQAVQLINLIEKEFSVNLPPIKFIQNPSIRALSEEIGSEKSNLTWSSLVPLKTTGNKTPLFTIHAGGGHIFFYNGLVKYLDKEQPVYSLQPLGFDTGVDLHRSIEEMSIDYLKEIKKVQPKGPYKILTTCFSQAVGVEIVNLLNTEGEVAPLFIVVDSAPYIPKETLTIYQRLRRLPTLSLKDWEKALGRKKNKLLSQIKIKKASLQIIDPLDRLGAVQLNLIDIYDKYKWPKFKGKLTFIRSSEFVNNPKKSAHIATWKNLALDGIDIYEVEGNHLTIFEEPEVQNLAVQIDYCIEDFDKQYNF